jgi:hypothetical protein
MAEENLMSDLSIDEYENLSLCEALDRVLNKGAVVVGELTISVADVDLLYLGLQVILASIETARGVLPNRDGLLALAAKDKGGENAGPAHQKAQDGGEVNRAGRDTFGNGWS